MCNWKEGDKDSHLYSSMNYVPAPTTAPALALSTPNSGNLSPDTQGNGDQKKYSEQVADSAKKGVPDESQKLTDAVDNSDSSLAVSEMAGKKRKFMVPGCLVMQRYSWRTVQFDDPVLTISTTGTKGIILVLPPG